MTELDILRLAQDFLWDGVWAGRTRNGMPDDRTPAICTAIVLTCNPVTGSSEDPTYEGFSGVHRHLLDKISKRLGSYAFYTSWVADLSDRPAEINCHLLLHRQAARWVWLQLLIREAEQNGGYLAPEGAPSIDWAMWRQRVKDVETKVQQGEQA